MKFEEYVQMIAADKTPALSLALEVVRVEGTVENLEQSHLNIQELDEIGCTFRAAVKLREFNYAKRRAKQINER
jgi:hypothetical protein